MSLVNQMLKDLASRSKPLSNPELILTGLKAASSKKKSYQHYALFVMSAVLLVLGAFGLQMYFKPKPFSFAELIPPNATISEKSSFHPETTVATSSTSLTGIALQVNDRLSQLHLLLDQNVLYRVSHPNKSHLVIFLENTKAIPNLPAINTINSAIKNIETTHLTDGSLKININLNTDVEVRHLALEESTTEHAPELNIELLSLKPEPSSTQALQQSSHPALQPIKKVSYNTNIDDVYQQAIRYIDQGQMQEATVQLTQLLEKYPKFVPARKSYVALLLNESKVAEAEIAIDIGLEQLPFYPPYIQLKAQILVEKGQVKEALKLLKKAPPALEENPDYHAFLAALYQRENESMLSEKIYEQLLNLQPNNSIWWIGLGVARESLNKNISAMDAYAKANNSSQLSPELKVYVENRIRMLS